ncbi:7725_t:CDS:2, partial [Scutellospora calospora]
MGKAKKRGHPLSEFVKIYPEKLNSFNHLCRCIYCIAVLGEEDSDNQKFTNSAKCVKSHLNQSTNAGSSLKKHTLISKRNKVKLLNQFIAHNMSNQEKQNFNKLWLHAIISAGMAFCASENPELQAVFTFLNPTIKLPTRQNLSRTILNNATTYIQNEIIKKVTEEEIIVTLSMDEVCNDIKSNNIKIACIVTDSAAAYAAA